jgi:hypothetical protein
MITQLTAQHHIPENGTPHRRVLVCIILVESAVFCCGFNAIYLTQELFEVTSGNSLC